MATYYSDVYSGPNPFTLSPSDGVIKVLGKVTIPAGTAVADADVLKILKLPAGAYLLKVRQWNNSWGTDVPGIWGVVGVDTDCVSADVILETSRTVPLVYIHEGNTDSSGVVTETKFTGAVGALTAAADLQITIGTTSAPTATGEKYLTFLVEFVDVNSARGLSVGYTYNGLSSLVAGVSS